MRRSFSVGNFAEWHTISRQLLAAHIHPDSVTFSGDHQGELFSRESIPSPVESEPLKISKAFFDSACFVAMHRSTRRWDLLYRILYRLVHLGERHLLKIEVDPDVRDLALMRKAVARDIHKMHAFVRFRKVSHPPEPEQFVAWHRPDHFIVEHVAPWFVKRFGAMKWAIMTPDGSAYWDTKSLQFGPGSAQAPVLPDDELENLWLRYYASVFNPARLNVDAMKKELPVRHWPTLPEAQMIPRLISEAAKREQKMRELNPPSAEEFLPADHSLPALLRAVKRCEGCELYRAATQAVFGEGPSKAKIMFVGEQPGDQEDTQGLPFVGPAGKLLNKALEQAGIDRSNIYVTNAVKHFKFEERGKRRIHKKPKGSEVAACRPWLAAEVAAVDPAIIVALGATAALSVGGREFAIQKERGKFLSLANGRKLLVTVHPSFLLRVPETEKANEFAHFVRDLTLLSDSSRMERK